MAPESNVELLKLLPLRNRAMEYKFLVTSAKIEIKLVFLVKCGKYFCGSALLFVNCENHRGYTFNESHNFTTQLCKILIKCWL